MEREAMYGESTNIRPPLKKYLFSVIVASRAAAIFFSRSFVFV